MKIIYVGKHDQKSSNDDEGAIAYALGQLGHEVVCYREDRGRQSLRERGDLLLFHHWSDFYTMRQVTIPKVFWYFDLVQWSGDDELQARNRIRLNWMREMIPFADLGFCTDGDWAAQHPGKLVWLPQGADERIIGRGNYYGDATPAPLLFTGVSRGGGRAREGFVEELKARYGNRFHHVAKGCYRTELADLIDGAKLVVAPDSPITDRYWSNRVYMAAGFGATVLHPFCAKLAEHYRDEYEVVYYQNRAHLYELIDYYLDPNNAPVVDLIGRAAIGRTRTEHTYRHRLTTLLDVVRQRLGV